MSNGQTSSPPPDLFRRQLTIATYGLLFVVLVIHVLKEFKDIPQPLFVAVFVGYVLYPVQRWLINRGVRPLLASVLILFVFVGVFVGIGQAVYVSAASLTPERIDSYRDKLEQLINKAAVEMGYQGEELPTAKLRKMLGGNVTGQDISAQHFSQFGRR